MARTYQGTAGLRADGEKMSGQVEFFYDYVSVYSYLADSQLGDLAGAEVLYRPMFLGGVMEATGNRPPGTVEAKREYLHTDIDRWAARYSLPLKMNPVFPQNTLKALRLALVAQKEGGFETVHRALFDAMWVQEKDLSDGDLLAEIAAQAGVSIGAIEDAAIKDELKASTKEAVARGAFGAPTFFVGEQMFFGNDRFEFIEEAIRNRGL
jgi:2-hydroxychromene-2-carboxylate isomerase